MNILFITDPNISIYCCFVLQVNVRACKSLGHPYLYQLSKIYSDMINVYMAMSQNISGAIGQCGEQVMEQSIIKRMRLLKKETLILITNWISCSKDPSLALNHLIPPLLDAFLCDYHQCVPSAREPEVLSTLATIVNKLGGNSMTPPHISKILEAVFQVTIQMINKNFQEFPEHRLNFYLMIQAVNKHCFPALLNFFSEKFGELMDAIYWCFKHTKRNVAETGLHILYHLLQNMSQENDLTTQYFYKTYFLVILQHVFEIVTDTSHTCSLTTHAKILAYMFSIVEMGMVKFCFNQLELTRI